MLLDDHAAHVSRDAPGRSQPRAVGALDRDALVAAGRGEVLLLQGAEVLSSIAQVTHSYLDAASRELFGASIPDDLAALHTRLDAASCQRLHAHIHARPRQCEFVPRALAQLLEQAGLAERTLLSWEPHFRLHTPDGAVALLKATPPHRDSFYGLPDQGINLWVACTATRGASVVFYPELFGRALRTTAYDPGTYHPTVLGVDLEAQPKLIPDCQPGDCLIFSGEQLHQTAPNHSGFTRVSWDYRALLLDGLKPSLRLHEFVLTSSLLLDRTPAERERITQQRLRTIGARRTYWVRGLSAEYPSLPKAANAATRIAPNIGHYVGREAQKRLPRLMTRAQQARRVLTYSKQLLYPGHRYSALRRSIAYLTQTDLKWKQRGSEKGLELGQYMEFGVWNGESMIEFSQVLKDYVGEIPAGTWHMYGFDSFTGLPAPQGEADEHPFVAEGGFRSQGRLFVEEQLISAGISRARFDLYEGMFADSLTEALKQRIGRPKVSLVNIDVDYYSSTLQALEWVEELLGDGSLIYFDDIFFYNGNPRKGQLRAISEFNAARSNSGLYEVKGLDPWGRVYAYWRDQSDAQDERLQFDR